MKKAFTLIEIIFVIVLIGVLSAVAIPKFASLSDNAKISAEMQTASAVQSSLDNINAQWISSRCEFSFGAKDLNSTTLNTHGYPVSNATNGNIIEQTLKNVKDWTCNENSSKCTGPASTSTKGVKKCKADTTKPCITRYWKYDATKGTFELIVP